MFCIRIPVRIADELVQETDLVSQDYVGVYSSENFVQHPCIYGDRFAGHAGVASS